MTLLHQTKPATQAPHMPAVSDVTGIFDQAWSMLGTVFPKLIALAYFAVVFFILLKLWRDRKKINDMPFTELAALGILFALMR